MVDFALEAASAIAASLPPSKFSLSVIEDGDHGLIVSSKATEVSRQRRYSIQEVLAGTLSEQPHPVSRRYVPEPDLMANWYAASSWVAGSRFRPARLIKPVVDDSALPLLTDRIRRHLPSLLAICDHVAKQNGIPLEAVEIRGERDLEEGWTEIVVQMGVNANAEQALAYWDSLGRAIDRWAAFLPADDARLVRDELAVHVIWP